MSVFIKVFLSLLFLGGSLNLLGQNINRDSLIKVWNNRALADSIRFDAVHKIAWNVHLHINQDSSRFYAQQQFEFAKKRGNKKEMAKALNTQGVTFAIEGNHSRAVELLMKSLKAREKTDSIGIAAAWSNIGNIYKKQGNFLAARKYYKRGLDLSLKIGDKKGEAYGLSHIANTYHNLGDVKSAIDYDRKALEVHREIKNNRGVALTLLNLASLYETIDSNQVALEYANDGLDIYLELEELPGIVSANNQLGLIYYKLGDYKKSKDYSLRSLKTAKKIRFWDEIIESAANLNLIYKKEGNYLEALEMYELYVSMKDSTENIEAQRKVIEVGFEYENERNKERLEYEFAKEQNLLVIDQKSKTINYLIVIALLIFVVLTFMLFTSRLKHRIKLKTEKEKQQSMDIEFKNKELTQKVLYIKQLNDQIALVISQLKISGETAKEKVQGELNGLIRELKLSQKNDIWQEFESYFCQIHSSFYINLQEECPSITSNEKKLCAFLKLNMNTKEIAILTNTKPSSVDMARSRLKKKLTINDKQTLYQFINSL